MNTAGEAKLQSLIYSTFEALVVQHVVRNYRGEEYKDDEIKTILINSRNKIEKEIDEKIKIQIISFPIIKKDKLKERIAYKVEKYDKECR